MFSTRALPDPARWSLSPRARGPVPGPGDVQPAKSGGVHGEPAARHLITRVLESQNVIVTTETDAAPTLLAAV